MSNQIEQVSVLVVASDQQLLGSIARILAGRVKLTLEANAQRARTLLTSNPGFAVIVSDPCMPGVEGLGLLRLSREVSPDTVRILISGALDAHQAVAAVNDCQVFRLLLKPFRPQALLDAVLAAGEQHRLVTAERVLLEETLQGSVQALAELFLLVQPAAFGRAMRLRRHVADLAQRLGVTPRWDVEIAALLSQIGSVVLSAETLDRWYHGHALSEAEAAEIKQLPKTAESLIANIPRLDRVREILRLQDEMATTEGVPPGARLLAIARDFDLLIAQGETADNALAIMQGRAGRYDRSFLDAFRSLRGSGAPRSSEIVELRLSEVREPMVLASDVHSPTGLLLIARGQRVTPGLLQRVRGPWRGFAGSCRVRVIVHP